MVFAFAAAITGMLFYGVASVAQGSAATRAEGPAVLRHPAYVAGLVCDGLAWLCSLVALGALPLFVVQSILAGSLAVTVLLAWPLLKVRPTRRDALAVLVVTTGLVLVSASAGGESTMTPPSWTTPVFLAALAALVVLAAASYRRGPSWLSALAAGAGFSGSALCARVAHLGVGDPVRWVTEPLAWAAVVYGVIGAVMYARALERGELGPATATMWVVEVVLPGAVGVFALGDPIRPGWTWPALAGVALATAASVVLAQSPAQAEGADPANHDRPSTSSQ